jgi:cytochrome c
LIAAVAGSRVHADSTQQPVSSVFDGVFTAEQSARGKAQYLKTCKRCHKENLAGSLDDEVRPLVGDKFLAEWTKWTVGDLFEFLTTEMPPKRKDRRKLSAQNHVDILAYVLEQNGFPAGKTELVPTLEPLLEIEMSPSE